MTILGLESELIERQYDLENVRNASLPENLQYISQKLSEMEKDRSIRDQKMKEALRSNHPDMNRLMADQSHTISKLKNELTSKNNQFVRSYFLVSNRFSWTNYLYQSMCYDHL